MGQIKIWVHINLVLFLWIQSDFVWTPHLLSPPAGHFTQVVWKESTKLGVGMATNGNKAFVVGQYRPAGNMIGREYFEKNVLPLGNEEPQFYTTD